MSPVPAVGERSVEEQRPELSRFWVRYRPRRWPALEGREWSDLARGGLGEGASEVSVERCGLERPLDDVLYLPPVEARWAPARDRLTILHLERGTPVLVQVLPGDSAAPSGSLSCFDPLSALLAGDGSAVVSAPAGGAIWPLITGLSDDLGRWQEVCSEWRRRGVSWVQPAALELSPRQRRELSEHLGEASFDALFHAPTPDERPFCRVAARCGLEPFAPRLPPRPPLLGASNVALASQLGLAAELCGRLGEPESRVQALFRAARWVESAPRDVLGVAREGNLEAIPYIEGESRQLVLAAAAGELHPEPLGSLRRRYLEES